MREVENKRITQPLGFGCVENKVKMQAIGQTQVDVKADLRSLHSLPEPSMDLETSTDSIDDIPPNSSMPSSGEKTLNPSEEAAISRSSQLAAKRLLLSDCDGNLTDNFWRSPRKGLTKPLPKRKRMFVTSSENDKSDLNNFHDEEQECFLHKTYNLHPHIQSIHYSSNPHPHTQRMFSLVSFAKLIVLINLAIHGIVYVVLDILFGKKLARTNPPLASALSVILFNFRSEALATLAYAILELVIELNTSPTVAPANQTQPNQELQTVVVTHANPEDQTDQELQRTGGCRPNQADQGNQATRANQVNQANQANQASTKGAIANAFLFVFFTWFQVFLGWYDSYAQQ